MPSAVTLSAVTGVLKLLAAAGKLVPVAWETVSGVLDLAVEVCEIAQGVKDDKHALQEMAVDAGLSAIEITKIVQSANESEWAEYESQVAELHAVLEEMKKTAKNIAKKNALNRFFNRSKIKDDIADLESKLSKASARFNVHGTLRNTISIDALNARSDAILQAQRDLAHIAAQRHKEITTALAVTQEKTIAAVENTHITAQKAAELALLEKLNPVAAGWKSEVVHASIGACLAETRVQILDDISRWARAEPGSSSPSVFWLSGLAGTGKSTIARTVCELFTSQSMVCASFFFSRQSEDRHDPVRVACSLAFQLALGDDGLRAVICKAIQDNIDVSTRAIPDQVQLLLGEPLAACVPLNRQIVIVLDGLDECGSRGGKEAGGLLPLLAAVVCHPEISRSVRLFVTSRGEESIRRIFEDLQRDTAHVVFQLHEIERSIVRNDIVHYFDYNLRAITRKRPHRFPSGWPDQAEILALADRAGVLFVYAATLARFIDSDLDDPMEQLRSILDGTIEESGSVYASVDDLYRQILDRAVRSQQKVNHSHCQRLRDVLGSLILLREPLSATALARLIGRKDTDVEIVLENLTAVLIYSNTNPVMVFHPSFPEFLVDDERCRDKRFEVVREVREAMLGKQCLVLMNAQLKRDICDIRNPSLFNVEVPDLASRLGQAVSPELAYACRYWATHLSGASARDSTLPVELLQFCRTKLLYWVEVLSLMGILRSSYSILDNAQQYISQSNDPSLAEAASLLHDIDRLIREFYPAIHDSALHVYYSAIPMMPSCTLLETVSDEADCAVRLLSPRQDGWREPLQHTFQTASRKAEFLAFLSDGKRLLCTSTNMEVDLWSIHIWDVTTGELLVDVSEEQIWVNDRAGPAAVSLSPDTTLVLGSLSGKYPKIWSTATGKCTVELIQPDKPPYTFVETPTANAFSSDGQHVVTADGESIQLWDTCTGVLERVFVASFSRGLDRLSILDDGKHILSVDRLRRLVLWDIQTARIVADNMDIYTIDEEELLMSPDTKCIAAVVQDNLSLDNYGAVNFQIWNTDGTLSRTVPIDSMDATHLNSDVFVFSRRLNLLVTRDNHQAIQLWSLETGTLIGEILQPEDKHKHLWSAAALSDDATKLVTGSHDGSVCVCDTRTRSMIAQLSGHSEAVLHVCISPDRCKIASYSRDGTLRLYDISNLQSATTIPGERETIRYVTVFEDGSRVASLSKDWTITIWNAGTGMPEFTMQGQFAVLKPKAERTDIPVYNSSLDDLFNREEEGRIEVERTSIPVYAVLAISADGSRIIAPTPATITQPRAYPRLQYFAVWDCSTGECLNVLGKHQRHITGVSLTASGHIGASMDEDSVYLWDLHEFALVGEIKMPGREFPPMHVALSPSGSHMVAHHQWGGGPISVVDFGRKRYTMRRPPIPAASTIVVHSRVKFTQDRLYAFLHGDSTMAIHVWDVGNNLENTTAGPINFIESDPERFNHWIWCIPNGDVEKRYRLCWVPPDRHPNMHSATRDNNWETNILTIGSARGLLTILDFTNVMAMMSSMS